MKTRWILIIALLFTTATVFGDYEIRWSTIDGGGRTSSGGSYTVKGTIGQHDAANSYSDQYSLLGGFWPGFGYHIDSDGDGVPDSSDVCPGFDDHLDADEDDIPNGCDSCFGNNDSGDSDGDAVCDDLDALAGCNDYANLYSDLIINFSDFAVLAADYGCTSGCTTDIDGDGDTDIEDLSIIAANWLCGNGP